MNYTETLKRNYPIYKIDYKKIEKWKCKQCSNLIENGINMSKEEKEKFFIHNTCKLTIKGKFTVSDKTYFYYHQLYKLKRCPLIPIKIKKPKQIEMTHSECIEHVANWLRSQSQSYSPLRCKIILKEYHGYNLSKEYPDILGTGMRNDINIECKVSRQDFFHDQKKNHKHPFGNFKFYACPEGLIKPEEIPEKFGLIYVNKKTCKVIKKPEYVKECENVGPMLADLFLERKNGAWDGKAVIL